MLTPSDLDRIAEVCRSIGNQVTDEDGFVPVRELLTRFHAALHIRPLLVEGMLAALDRSEKSSAKWAVLIDSETHKINYEEVSAERQTKPLPSRLRNTVAHELVHSLAFRTSEFGIRLRATPDTEERLGELVRDIERETERLSPLLLWSEKALAKLLDGTKGTISLADLLFVVENLGISRYVLISRLRLIQPSTDPHGFLFSAGLRNLAVGIGEWRLGGPILKGWPLFWNFDEGNVPSFLLRLPGQESISANTIFSDPQFALCSGPDSTIQMDTDLGTRAVPNARKASVQVAVEDRHRRPGEEFLFVVRKPPSAASSGHPPR